MSAIAHFLESEGLQTTGISLVRENTEALRPPRFLWTSFPLGRPLGQPGDPAFQRRVIMAALALLEREHGPVLEDFPEDAPEPSPEQTLACPVSFAPPGPAPGTWLARLSTEAALLRPWYELSLRRRGRSTVGVAKAPIGELIERLANGVEARALEGLDLKALKYALEDLKSYYQEALTAQPGPQDWRETTRILWQQTELGRAMRALHGRFLDHPDRRLQAFARGIAPRTQTGR